MKCIEGKGVDKKQRWGLRPIETPKGTLWAEVTIYFKKYDEFGGECVFIVRGERHHRNFKTMGFADKRKRTANKGWILLFLLLINDGILPRGKSYKHLAKKVSDLNKTLNELCPDVEGNPFGPYQKRKGWKPNMVFTTSQDIRKEYGKI